MARSVSLQAGNYNIELPNGLVYQATNPSGEAGPTVYLTDEEGAQLNPSIFTSVLVDNGTVIGPVRSVTLIAGSYNIELPNGIVYQATNPLDGENGPTIYLSYEEGSRLDAGFTAYLVDNGWISGAGGGTVLSLTYAAQGPFDFLCWSVPDGFTGSGIATVGAQIIVGTNIGSGILLDANSSPLPDGWSFPAVLFIEDNNIWDIIAFNAFTIGNSQGGIIAWTEGGAPIPLPLPGGLSSPGVVVFDGLPTSDPANPGQLWNSSGTVKVSAG